MNLTVKPRDLRTGDLLPQMQDDYPVVEQEIVSVEAIRPHKATVYKVTIAGDDRPLYFQAGASVEITRSTQEAK